MVNVLKSMFSKETVLAIVMGLVTRRFMDKKKAIQSTQIFANPPQLVDPKDVFTSNEYLDLINVWEDDAPEGKFLKGRHGVTHYKVDRNDEAKSKKGMVILCHGLGQSLKMYKEFSDILVDEGFSVLRYDYFGHGYSKYIGEDMWVKYTPDMFVDQLEDLIDHVTKEENEDIVAFVGHSNGGVVGIAANHRWSTSGKGSGSAGDASKRNIFPKLILANPAVYASKPLLARVADSIPTVMTALFKTIPPSRALIGENYIESITKAFGKNENGEYMYPEAFKASMDQNERLFGLVEGVKKHPFLEAAILGVSSYCIAGHLLPLHRERLSALAKGEKGEILFVWGDKDVTVPYVENVNEVEQIANNSNIMKLEVLENISHECFLENSPAVAALVLPNLNA